MNAPTLSLSPDKTAMLGAMAAMFDPEDVVELRAFHKGRKRTDAGYFDGDHRQDLADAAARLNAEGAAVYVTLNKLDPQLLSRYCNRVENFASATATDRNVIRRRWLLLDFDPIRPKDTSATSAQLDAAKAKARECYSALKRDGWPEPLAGASGNGWHLLYPIDLPNDDESRDLVKGALSGLAKRFNDDVVTVDQSVFNAGRITKLFGTVATKGDHTPVAPWRLSKLKSNPARCAVVSPEQLRALQLVQDVVRTAVASASAGQRMEFDLTGFMARLNIEYEHDQHDGADRYKLKHCPFNADHGQGEAAVFRAATGGLGFKCQHSSCADKHWQDVRALVDGPKELRRSSRVSVNPVLDAMPTTESAKHADAWPDPQPLVSHSEAAPYPLAALPGCIGAAVREVVGFVQCPDALAACSALTAASTVAQGLANVRRGAGLSGPISLYLLAIAESGERKSSCDGYFTASIADWEAQKAEEAKPGLARHAADSSAWGAKRDGILNAIKQATGKTPPKSTTELQNELRDLELEKPVPPKVPRLIYKDVTSQKLGERLATGWPSGAIISAEAGIVLGGHSMKGDSQMGTLSLLNSLWSDETSISDRRTTESYVVHGARLTMGLATQPDTVRAFFEATGGLARGSGFAARFLIAWPTSTQGERLFRDAPETWPHLSAFNRRVGALLDWPLQFDERGGLAPTALDLSPEARCAWIAFHDEVEKELRIGGDMTETRDVASKCADNAARLAALFHVFEHGPSGQIGLDAMQSACTLAAWHLYEARRFLGELALPVAAGNALKLDDWLGRYCEQHRVPRVLRNVVQRRGPSPLRDGQALDKAIAALVEAGRVRIRLEGREKWIDINPALLGKHHGPA